MQEIKEQVQECYKETVRRIQNVEHSARLFKMSVSLKKKQRLEDCSKHKEL